MTVTFHAEIYKVQTLVDGGLRLTLDLPETAIAQAAQMMDWKRNGAAIKIDCIAIQEQCLDAVETRTKRKSSWAPPEGKTANKDSGNSREQDG